MIMAAPLPRTFLQYEHIRFPLIDLDTEQEFGWEADLKKTRKRSLREKKSKQQNPVRLEGVWKLLSWNESLSTGKKVMVSRIKTTFQRIPVQHSINGNP